MQATKLHTMNSPPMEGERWVNAGRFDRHAPGGCSHRTGSRLWPTPDRPSPCARKKPG